MTSNNTNLFMMALMILMTVGLIAAVSTTVGYATKISSRDYEYEMLRKDYQERIEKEKKIFRDTLDKLEKRMESDAYLNKRRYELLSAEINELCYPAIQIKEEEDNNKKNIEERGSR